MRRPLAGLVAGILAATGLALFTTSASAEETPPPPTLVEPLPAVPAPLPVVNPTSGPVGTDISVTVPGCTGFVSAAFGSEEGDILEFNVSSGDTTHLVVPAEATPGTYVVVAGCDVYTENDINGVEFTVTQSPATAVVATPHVTG
ncbi:MAG TPA: hypothetical protein VK549_04965 [Acidimicrobiia bacterium]|nr:hypothetical protein [Acidimicrobiia bacterium]